MKKVLKTTLATVMLLLLVFSITASVTACKSAEAPLPVHKTGDQWVYKMIAENMEYSVTVAITGSDITNGKDCYITEWRFEPPLQGLTDNATVRIDKATMFTEEARWTGTMLGPFSMIITYDYQFPGAAWWPLEKGKEIRVIENKVVKTNVMGLQQTENVTKSSRYKVMNIEEITVDSGTFRCFRIVEYDESNQEISESWYSAEVKNDVRSINYEDGTIMELKSFTF